LVGATTLIVMRQPAYNWARLWLMDLRNFA
jgi:hypothetical protein